MGHCLPGVPGAGLQVVPVDARLSGKLVKRIQREVKARLLVHDDTVERDEIELRKLSFHEIQGLPTTSPIHVQDVSPSDIVEIAYTSGTTAEPKEVVHRHNKICANLGPFQTEIERYKKWACPFQPIRILDCFPSVTCMASGYIGDIGVCFFEASGSRLEKRVKTSFF